jgi:hypothetical protein
MTVRSGFLICSKACIRGLGTAKCNHPLKFTGCIDEKDILSFVMLLVGCSSAARQDQSAQDATESFYKSYLSAFGSDEARPILPTNCVNMFLLILLLALAPFRKSLNKS